MKNRWEGNFPKARR